MSEIINFLTSKEIIMVYVVVILACVLYFVIHFIDKFYYQKRKQRQNTKELNRLVEDINYKLSKERDEDLNINSSTLKEESAEDIVYIEPVLEMFNEETMPKEEKEIEIVEPLVEIIPINNEVKEEQLNEVEDVKVNIENIKESEDVKVNIENIKEAEDVKLNIENIKETENISDNLENTKDLEVLDYTNVEPNRTEAQEELRKLTEALEQAEESSKNIDLTTYEEMQEKEAIISLEELLKRSKEMYENNELTQYADEGNEPISLEDLERKVKENIDTAYIENIVTEEPINKEGAVETLEPEIIQQLPKEKFIMDDFYSIKEEQPKSSTAYQHYQSTPIISPIYGLEQKQTPSNLELENTANYEKLDEEIKKTNEFIMTLKELQQNLD